MRRGAARALVHKSSAAAPRERREISRLAPPLWVLSPPTGCDVADVEDVEDVNEPPSVVSVPDRAALRCPNQQSEARLPGRLRSI